MGSVSYSSIFCNARKDFLPLNPQGFGAVSEHLSFNTAISFVTNTNWQSYGGETTMGHLVQMIGFTVQNFLSAATGIALAIAVTRAFARSGSKTIGNFWVDLTRTTLYILLPLSIIAAIFLRSAPSRPERSQQTLDRSSGRPATRKKSRNTPTNPVVSMFKPSTVDSVSVASSSAAGTANAAPQMKKAITTRVGSD